MQELRRNQLVWLHAQGWAQVLAHVWDAEAQALLAHWQRNKLPLVVCRQRLDVEPNQICLGLPAPLQWSRRRLALTVGLDQLAAVGTFPTLRQVARAMPWGPAALELEEKLTQLGVTPRVYGSHGWQWLTHRPYLHAASDLDLTLDVPDVQTASRVTALLAAAEAGPRLDGEIVFPDGQAVAWRELQRLLAGYTAHALLKDRYNIRLATLAELQELGRCAADEAAQATHFRAGTGICSSVGSTSVDHGGLKPALTAPWQTEVCLTNSEIG